MCSGKWYLLPAGCLVNFECISELDHFYFRQKLCDYDRANLLRKCSKPFVAKLPKDYTKFMDKCISGECVIDGLEHQTTAFEVLFQMLEKYNVKIQNENYSKYIMKAIIFINNNRSVKLTISEISDNIFVSKSALTKCFRKQLSWTGKSQKAL